MKLEELKEQKRWLCATESKAPHKVYSADMGGHNNTEDWGTYHRAKTAATAYNLPHVGVCLGNGLAGVDFDHVRNPETGDVVPEVLKLIEKLDTYTEISTSGTGIHMLMCVDPDRVGKRNRGDRAVYEWSNPAKDGKAAALAYGHPVLKDDGKTLDGARFYVFTGNIYKNYDEINERTSEFITLAGTYPPPEAEQKKPVVQTQQPKAYGFRIVELTNDILDKLKQNKVLNDLFNGNAEAHVQNHTDKSAVDQAFVGEALKTFDWNGNIVYTLWTESELYRDKCLKPYDGGATDYMGYTIQRYINNHHNTEHRADNHPNNEVRDRASGKAEPKKRSITFKPESHDHVSDYLSRGGFQAAIDARRKYANMTTGFKDLDKIQPLYPGLYVFGAGAGMGKTTFIHQLFDQIAEHNQPVIYITLEQDRAQLVSKSLARIMYTQRETDTSNWTVPAIDIYTGKTDPTPASIERYKQIANNIWIVEGNFETTVSDLVQYITDFMEQTGLKPVVCIDYLQIIPPEMDNPKISTMETVSRNVKALKKLQMDLDLVMFIISSLNRTNYYIPLDFESYKGTGDIEYSADCILGLELAILQAKIFEDENKKGLKRKIATEAKQEDTRYIRLVCLKNRFGRANFSVGFRYTPKYDTFECADLTAYYEDIRYRYDYDGKSDEEKRKESKETARKLIQKRKRGRPKKPWEPEKDQVSVSNT